MTGHEQAVLDFKGQPSSFATLNTGVPQGSVLGHLSFTLYTWDIPLGFFKEFLHLIYADDLQLYVGFPLAIIHQFFVRMSEHAELVSNWKRANNLRLNMVKTKAIVLGSYYYIKELAALRITSINLGHTVVKLKSTVQSLGVILDSKMNWKARVASICKRVYSLSYHLNFFFIIPSELKLTNFNLRKHLIQSLLFPIVDYCPLIWCDISNELNGKIQVAINAGIRYVFGIRKSDHITPYRSSLCWLTTDKRGEYFIVSLLYRLFTTKKPSYLQNRYITNNTSRTVKSNRPLLKIPPLKSEFLENSFYVKSSYLWNSSPPDVRNGDSITIFKKRAYAYFISLETGPTPLLIVDI